MAKNNDDLKMLITDPKRGEIYAFEKIYLNYRNYVYKMILGFFDYKITDIEDLMQEVFLIVYQQLKLPYIKVEIRYKKN